ncbi:MAG: nuclear transport factor 2 family protein [Pseudomonadota bacterium]
MPRHIENAVDTERAIDKSEPLSLAKITTLLGLLILAALPNVAKAGGCEGESKGVTRNLATLESLIDASLTKDIDTLISAFSSDAVLSQPFQPSGPVVLKGKGQIRSAYQRIFATFAEMRYVDQRFTCSADGSTIFAELQGDFDLVGSAGEYDNFFVFRVDFNSMGLITSLIQYQNSLYTSKVFAAPNADR